MPVKPKGDERNNEYKNVGKMKVLKKGKNGGGECGVLKHLTDIKLWELTPETFAYLMKKAATEKQQLMQ